MQHGAVYVLSVEAGGAGVRVRQRLLSSGCCLQPERFGGALAAHGRVLAVGASRLGLGLGLG